MTANAKEKDAKYLSVLMQKISEFAQNYGVDELINYLCDYQKDIAQDEYKKYKKIEKDDRRVKEISKYEGLLR